jgi:hypothetical protein
MPTSVLVHDLVIDATLRVVSGVKPFQYHSAAIPP